MKKQISGNSLSNDNDLSYSFSRRQMMMMNTYQNSSIPSELAKSSSPKPNAARCLHCGKYYCQIDFIFSWLSRYANTNNEQFIIDQRIQEIISKRLPSSNPQNVCEQRLFDWYKSMKINFKTESNQIPKSTMLSSSIANSFISNSLNVSDSDNLIDYNQYILSQSHSFSLDEPLLSPTVCNRLLSSIPTQTFQTQNRAGLYQLCSNGRYIIADDWCQTYKGRPLAHYMRCLTIYNQYEEQCVLMLPEFNTMTQMDSVQSMTWHQKLQVFLFITYHRIYQCEPESGAINQINEYEIPSSRHTLAHIACDQQSYVFLAYEYPAVSLDLWYISTMATWSLIKRWTPRELFPPVPYQGEDEEYHSEHNNQFDQESGVCGIASMRYANDTLHFLARHERHWCLHLFSLNINEKYPKLIPQRRIDIDLVHLRFAGENFQMEVLPGEQGWLFAIRRPYLIHLNYNGKDAQKVILATSKRGTDSIFNVCIMDERGKRRENGKHLVVRDANSIRFYKL